MPKSCVLKLEEPKSTFILRELHRMLKELQGAYLGLLRLRLSALAYFLLPDL
jgi:hypothetical protein